MGKQYRFYLSSANLKKIIDYSKQNGFFYLDSRNNLLETYSYNMNTRCVYLCKTELGNVIVLDKSRLINTDVSPVIQLTFTRVNTDMRFIEHGRIWISNALMDGEYKALNKYISSLTKKYKLNYKGCTYSCNMDEETYMLVKQGYGFS